MSIRRIDVYCGGSVEPISFIWYTPVHRNSPVSAVDMEGMLHRMLAKHRLVGEWFELPQAQVMAALGLAFQTLCIRGRYEPKPVDRCVDKPCVDRRAYDAEEKRKAYRREWMRKRRERSA